MIFLHSTTWPPIFYWTQQVNLQQKGVTAHIVSCKQGLQLVDIYKSHASGTRKEERVRKKERKKERKKIERPCHFPTPLVLSLLASLATRNGALYISGESPLDSCLDSLIYSKVYIRLNWLETSVEPVLTGADFEYLAIQPPNLVPRASLLPRPTENLGTRLTTSMCAYRCAHLLKATSSDTRPQIQKTKYFKS